jgi:hypothetical protein
VVFGLSCLMCMRSVISGLSLCRMYGLYECGNMVFGEEHAIRIEVHKVCVYYVLFDIEVFVWL